MDPPHHRPPRRGDVPVSQPARATLPGDPGWEPTRMETAAWAILRAGRAVLVAARTTLTKTERRRRLASAHATMLVVFFAAWCTAGAITLATTSDLFTAVLWAATAALVACGTWMGLLWSAWFAALDRQDGAGHG